MVILPRVDGLDAVPVKQLDQYFQLPQRVGYESEEGFVVREDGDGRRRYTVSQMIPHRYGDTGVVPLVCSPNLRQLGDKSRKLRLDWQTDHFCCFGCGLRPLEGPKNAVILCGRNCAKKSDD